MSIDSYEYWIEQLEREKKAHGDFRKKADDVAQIFLNEKDGDRHSFNLFWSNVQILHAALYAETPIPDVRRRHAEQGDVEKTAALVVERSISYQLDATAFDSNIDCAVDSYLTTALGVNRVKYKPQLSKDQEGNEFIQDQIIELEYFPYDLFHWEPCKTWEQCDWIAFDHYMGKKAFAKKFKVDPEALDHVDETEKVLVHEIYHKPSRKIIVIAKGVQKILDSREDALKLKQFYPCPKPLFANTNLKKLVPKPDYCLAEKQYKEVSKLSDRISAISRSIKAVGFYDAQLKQLAQLAKASDGELIPVENLIDRLNGTSDIAAVVANWPIEDKVRVISALREELEAKKQEIYEIYGISDIIRGASQASESATAQQIKGNWANIRIGRRQKQVAIYVRDIFRIFAEIISEHFEPEVLQGMTGVQVTPELMQVLKNDITRGFAIDVETDSTVAKDEQDERQQKLELLAKVTELLSGLWPAVVQGTLPADVVKEMILMVVRSFKHGRTLEDAIEGMTDSQQMVQQLQQQSQQLQQQLEQTGIESQQQMQQAQAQIQQLQQQIEQFNQREEAREDAETQADVTLKSAQANKLNAETQKTIREPIQPALPQRMA